VKCFTREVPGLRERYSAIGEYLAQVRLPFTVQFRYLEQGVRVRGLWYPVLKMQWVEGLLLNEFVRGALDKPAALEGLAKIMVRMGRRLRKARVAHGDLQHGNIMLVLGSGTGGLAVKLVDYDGMYVPALAQNKPGELGHPAYQHPQRLREGTYGPEVDRFPLLAIYCALRGLIVGGRALWERYDNGDNLLFREQDFRSPRDSALFRELVKLNDPEVRRLADQLSRAAYKPLDQVPLLEDLVTPPRSSAPPATPKPVAVPVAPATAVTAGYPRAGGSLPPPEQWHSRELAKRPQLWFAMAAVGSVLLMGILAAAVLLVLNLGPDPSKTERAIAERSPPVPGRESLAPSKSNGSALVPETKREPLLGPGSEPERRPVPEPELRLRPMARWTFDKDARDSVGTLHGTLHAGAKLVVHHYGSEG
jgi:hypothetical protein